MLVFEIICGIPFEQSLSYPKMLFVAFFFFTFGIKFVQTSTFGKNSKCIQFLDVFSATQCFLPTYHRGVSNAAPIAELWNVSPFDCLTYCIVNAGKTGVSYIFFNSLPKGTNDVNCFLGWMCCSCVPQTFFNMSTIFSWWNFQWSKSSFC